MDGETANGSLDQLIFIRSYVATWITVVILELIHANKLSPLVEAGVLLLGQNQRDAPSKGRRQKLVTLDNFPLIARPSRRRRIFQMSALSSLEGRCYAYLAYNG